MIAAILFVWALVPVALVGLEFLVGLIGLGIETAKSPPACEIGYYRSVDDGPCELSPTMAQPIAAAPAPEAAKPPTLPARDCRTVPFAELRECMLGPGR
jgi:hypothetical protein